MKIRLIGGHSHGMGVEWDLGNGDRIQAPYRESGSTMLDSVFGIECYTIQRFYAPLQTERDAVTERLWYVAVLCGLSDTEAAHQFGPFGNHDLPHRVQYRGASPVEQAQWDHQHRNDTKDS